MKGILGTIIFIAAALYCSAQRTTVSRWAVEGNAGILMAYTDVEDRDQNIASQGQLSFYFNRWLGLTGFAQFGDMSAPLDTRIRAFTGNYVAFGSTIQINLAQLFSRDERAILLSPYGNIGFGMLSSSITVQPGAESFPFTTVTSTPYIPVTAGFYLYLHKNFDLSFSGSANIGLADEMDGIAPEGIGNQYNDAFITAMVGLRIKAIGHKSHHISAMYGRRKMGRARFRFWF